MAKIITDEELLQIIQKVVKKTHAIGDEKYEMFLASLSDAVAGYYSLVVSEVQPPDDIEDEIQEEADPNSSMSKWTIPFEATAETPMIDNPFVDYDTDVSFDEWLSDIS